MSNETCPACAQHGDCGGSNHPSCGCFIRGRACTALQQQVYHSGYKVGIESGLSEEEAEKVAYLAAKMIR